MEIGSSYISSWRQASQGFGPELPKKTGLWLYCESQQSATISCWSKTEATADQYGLQLEQMNV